MIKHRLVPTLFLAWLAAGCTWVKLTPQAENIRVVSIGETGNCKKLGQASVSLRNRIAGFNRNPDKVAQELKVLGRNSAAEMNGDTIVAVSGISNGEQTFDIYRCLP